MKILLYHEDTLFMEKSGIGRAFKHQKKALEMAGVDFTTDKSDQDYDLLHINTYGLNSFYMIQKAKKAGKKVLYHAHSNAEDFQNSFIGSNQIDAVYKKYLVNLYSKGDALITPTTYAKEILQSYGMDQPIYVVSNGIDLKKYTPDSNKEHQFREYFNLKADDKVIISVGLFFHRKGLVDFVKIAESLPEYTFIWFGDTPLYTIPKDIREIVQGKHPENVIFPGYIAGDIIEGAYSNADLFFFPSYEETEGIVVLEALASHQKVLVRDIPVYHGWLEDGYNVHMGSNNEDFTKKIPEIINDSDETIREHGFEVAQARSIEKIGLQLKNTYEAVLQGPTKE